MDVDNDRAVYIRLYPVREVIYSNNRLITFQYLTLTSAGLGFIRYFIPDSLSLKGKG